jgi:hypothetical protein
MSYLQGVSDLCFRTESKLAWILAQALGGTAVIVLVHTVLVEAIFENHFAESFM